MTKQKILMIEDDSDCRMLYSECLRMEGYEPSEAASGKEAIEKLGEESRPDLILMDLTLPDMTAQKVVDFLRASPGLTTIPLILLSGRDDIRDQARHLGATAYVSKPINLDPFLNLIKDTVGDAS